MSVGKQEIIKYLSNQVGYVRAFQIARYFNVSTKTIYRKVDAINNFQNNIIVSSRGKGFKLKDNFLPKKIDYTNKNLDGPIQRRNRILLKLLFNSPNYIDYSFLYRKIYVSDSTINADINILKDIVKKYNLNLFLKGKKIAILGSERKIRECINQILQFNKSETGTIIKGINKYDDKFIHEQLKFIETSTGFQVPYPYNINIFSHIYILIRRARRSFSLKEKNNTLKDIPKNKMLYRISSMVIENVENYIVKKLPEYEIDYLYCYLTASRLTSNNSKKKINIKYSKKVNLFTINLISNVLKELGYREKVFPGLKDDLISHIGPMINRLKNNISVENSILPDIKLEYLQLFKLVKSNLSKICQRFDLREPSENEVGFIVLYFEKYIEQMNKTYHVWIVCASGVGTSELLKTKISRSFNNISVDKVLSSVDDKLKNIPNGIDLVISTVKLKQKTNKKVVIVSAFLSNMDKENIRHELQNK